MQEVLWSEDQFAETTSISEKLPTSPQAEGLSKSARFDLPSAPPALGSEHPNQIRVLLPNDLLFLAHHCLIGTQSVLISSSWGESAHCSPGVGPSPHPIKGGRGGAWWLASGRGLNEGFLKVPAGSGIP